MIINHNLGLPRYAIGIRFMLEDDTPAKGGVFSIHDDNKIELDEDWLEAHPEIVSVEVFGVGKDYQHLKASFTWGDGNIGTDDITEAMIVEQDEPEDGQRTLDFVAVMSQVIGDLETYGICCMTRSIEGNIARVDPTLIMVREA